MEMMATCLERLLYNKFPEGFPEEIIGKITLGVVSALHYLKEKHSIMHRDVKVIRRLGRNDVEMKCLAIEHPARLVRQCEAGRLRNCGTTDRLQGGYDDGWLDCLSRGTLFAP